MKKRDLFETLEAAGARVEGARSLAGLAVWGTYGGRRFEVKSTRWWAFRHATVRLKLPGRWSPRVRADRIARQVDSFERAFAVRAERHGVAERLLTDDVKRALTRFEAVERFSVSGGWALVELDPDAVAQETVQDSLALLARVVITNS